MRLLGCAALLALCACPTAARPCTDDEDCVAGEVCVVSAGAGACAVAVPGRADDAGQPQNDDAGALDDAGPNDAGQPDDDAGQPVDDAGQPDDDAGQPVNDAGPAGRRLRGTIDVTPATLGGGALQLRGHITGHGPVTSSAGTLKLAPITPSTSDPGAP